MNFFCRWLLRWSRILAENGLPNTANRAVFNTCWSLTRMSLPLCQFIHPYLMESIILFGEVQQVENLVLEITEVLEIDANNQCTSTIFEILDLLIAWSSCSRSAEDEFKESAATSKRQKVATLSPEDIHNRINQFLQSIPSRLLATAAYRYNFITNIIFLCKNGRSCFHYL
jgi:hypothetical protein